MSLDNTPSKDTSSPDKPKRPRYRQRLFLSPDSDDETGPPSKPAAHEPTPALAAPVAGKDPALDALFLFADDDDDDTIATAIVDSRASTSSASKPVARSSTADAWIGEEGDEDLRYKPLAPALDLARLAREAEVRHARDRARDPAGAMSKTQETTEKDTADDATGGGGEGPKARRRPANLDEERLVGSGGLPQLMKDVLGFRPKGKGHEHADLGRLLQVYQFWAHRMYPRTPFSDTIDRVEKLCHSKRMQVRLSVLRDEAKGLVNGKKPEDDDSDDVDLTDPDPRANAGTGPGHDKQDTQSELPASRGSSPPPASSEPGDDDFDIEAVIQAEEARLAAIRATNEGASPVGSAVPHVPPMSRPLLDHGEQRRDMDVDEEAMWGALDAVDSGRSVPTPASVARPASGEDAEMWDVVDELEQNGRDDRAKQKEQTQVGASVPISSVIFALPVQKSDAGDSVRATNDEGWDEMYV